MFHIPKDRYRAIRNHVVALLGTTLILSGAGIFTAPASQAADTSQAATKLGWGKVIAGDEFNYTGKADSLKWGVYNSAGHAGKGIRSPSAVSVANGALTIKGDSQGTTGGMSAKFARQKYGRWETRMRVDHNDPQYHPVLILWPDKSADAYANRCWEIDYAEGNKGPGVMSFFNHIACSGTKHTWGRKTLDTRAWHNYAVEWSPNAVIGYIDGVKWFEDRNPANIANVSMHQTIQLDWFPNGQPTKPSQMQVDWVRVYGLSGSSSAPVQNSASIKSAGEVIAVDSSGVLWNYHNLKTTRNKIGAGWNIMDTVHNTDWNRDGIQDIIAKEKSGALAFYKGLAQGGFARTALGSAGWQDYAIDIAKWKKTDTYPSIIAKHRSTGDLYLYPNSAGKLLTRSKIGEGWLPFSVNLMDWDKDGSMDIVAKNSAGEMKLYRTNGSGVFINEGRKTIGNGWNIFNSITTVRNFQNSGTDGLLARDSSGKLFHYGTGASSWKARTQVGSGWAGYSISIN